METQQPCSLIGKDRVRHSTLNMEGSDFYQKLRSEAIAEEEAERKRLANSEERRKKEVKEEEGGDKGEDGEEEGEDGGVHATSDIPADSSRMETQQQCSLIGKDRVRHSTLNVEGSDFYKKMKSEAEKKKLGISEEEGGDDEGEGREEEIELESKESAEKLLRRAEKGVLEGLERVHISGSIEVDGWTALRKALELVPPLESLRVDESYILQEGRWDDLRAIWAGLAGLKWVFVNGWRYNASEEEDLQQLEHLSNPFAF